MKLRAIGIRRYLQVSSILIILGLLVEFVSLLWVHPISFVFFIFRWRNSNRTGNRGLSHFAGLRYFPARREPRMKC